MSFLVLEEITKSFGPVIANDNISLKVAKGEVHALLGENGAGKTTLMNILFGLYQADSGRIYINGEPADIQSPKHALDKRIGMVHQHFMLVPTLTVSQNITLGTGKKGHPFMDRRAVDEKICSLSEAYGLGIDPQARVEELSVGACQRVEIIKLLYHDAQLLILDEPTAVLTPQEVDGLFEVLKKLKAAGRSVIIITHRIAEVRAIADQVTVLRNGQVAGAMGINDIDNTGLSQLMIGRRLQSLAKTEPCTVPDPSGLLSLKEICVGPKDKKILDHLNLDIRPGEILGLAGVDGNGQKELAEVIVGIQKPARGSVVFDGREVTHMGVRERKKQGMAYIPDDRHQDGLVLDMDVTDNLMLSDPHDLKFSALRFLKKKSQKRHARKMIEAFRIKTPGSSELVRNLSGGNQQKVILARELNASPKLIVACQPTRGLDIGAEEFIAQTLVEQRSKGVGILLISADLEQLMTLSDRIAVIFDGQINAVMDTTQDISTAAIGLKMAGVSGEQKCG